MKRTILTVCALVMILTGCVPVYAASTDRAYYPIEVEETTEGSVQDYRIKKTYQLALTDDPVNIPTDDFMRNGLTYHLLDMTRKDDIGVDTQPYTETVTKPSDTDKMESILQNLDAELEVTTEEGYSGTLRLDHTSVQVTVDGYGTKTRSLSATRTYPNLSDADLSLIPKTIEDNGHTLTLGDVQWAESWQTGAEGAELRYSATASYTGSASSRYATGYTVTANYSGEVAKTGCDVVTYTAIFGVAEVSDEVQETEQPQEEAFALAEQQEAAETVTRTVVSHKQPIIIGVVALALAAGGVVAYKKIKERR